MLTPRHASRRPARQAPLIGRCLNDRYSLTSVIGEGWSSVIYAAQDIKTGGEVAIKAAHDGPQAAEAMRRERLAARVAHPFVCAVRDWGDVDGTLCTVFERIVGETLEARIAREPLNARTAVEIVIAILTALDRIHHAGLVHRDVTPTNIVLVESVSRRPIVKLIDFSVAQESTETSPPEWLTGTPAYMAPEQTQGAPATSTSDVFAAGVVLFETLAGRQPFSGASTEALFLAIREKRLPSLTNLRPDLPGVIDQVIQRATMKKPAERYPSAAAMALDLEVCVAALRQRG